MDHLIRNPDAVIVTYPHLDHFDDAVKEVLVQNEADAGEERKTGFLM
ncbi:hypothetical protein M654_018085 [Bacillus sp. NSP9.1]|nr:hypothetical protein M654_018085 [Bacillus sp. NSP9.1]